MVMVLWILFFILLYTYIGYPLLLIIGSGLLKGQRLSKADSYPVSALPKISLIIPAHNEELVIEEKIKNSLAIDYPRELYDIVIVSDGSEDNTNEIINRYATQYNNISFHSYPKRQGKANALNVAISHSKGDILVFTDANVMFKKESIRQLISNFSDPQIGGACGKVLLYSSISKEILGEGLYMKYERYIHEAESKIKTMIGTDGGMYAIRKTLYKPLAPKTILDDFVIAMQVVAESYSIVYEDKAIGYEEASAAMEDEFKRKVRIFAGGFQSLWTLQDILNPFKHPVVTFQFLSHKLFRWLSPIFMLGLLIANLFLLNQLFYLVLFISQVIFYSLALIGLYFPKARRSSFVYFPLYFSAVNLAALFGLFRYLSGRQKVTWERART